MKSFWKIVGGTVSAIILAGTIWVFFNIQTTVDWFRLRNYEPSPEISQLAIDASLSDKGRRLFYVHYPELLDKSNFQGKCTNTEETIVLGCYLSRDKIYVFDVDDDRLEGVEQVTAAHEMLHAVYDRLSDSEKEEIDMLVLEYFNNSGDERLKKSIESYKRRDPSVVPNELHSILATEIRELPQELEIHYSKYFVDRLSVVTLSEAYESEFTKLEDQIEEYDTQLARLSANIESQEVQLEQLGVALTQEQSRLDSLRSDPSIYNSAVDEFNQKVREYNNLLESLKNDIAEYNIMVEKRNSIAVEEQGLIEAIDTRVPEL
jgi:uncharacterized protein YukE